MAKHDRKNKGIVKVTHILADIFPRCYAIYDLGLCFLVLEEKRKWNIAIMFKTNVTNVYIDF